MAALDVQVEVPGFVRKLTFLVDSGAAQTLIPQSYLAGMPGLDSLPTVSNNMVSADGNKLVCRGLSATLNIIGLPPVQQEILVIPSGPFGLLGLNCWFELNKVVFMNKKSVAASDRVFLVSPN